MVVHWDGLSVCVFTNKMNNSAQFKDRGLRLLVLFLLTILEMHSSEQHWSVLPLLVFLENCVFEKNPLKICKTMISEEATVKPWERQWNHVTQSETMRVERSANYRASNRLKWQGLIKELWIFHFLVNFRFLFQTDGVFPTWNIPFERGELIKFIGIF